MALLSLITRVKRLEAQRRQSVSESGYTHPDITEEYVAEVLRLLTEYGLFASEEEALQALEAQARLCPEGSRPQEVHC